MQFYFIRHGQSTNNLLWERTGGSDGRREDPELTEVGRQQAALVAGFLTQADGAVSEKPLDLQNAAGFGITHLYCSLMVRAVATGSAVAQALGLPLVGLRDAHETGGIYLHDPETGENVGLPGKTHAYFADHYPNLVLPDDVPDSGWWNRPFEEREERRSRAERLVAELLARHRDTEDRVALVSHGGFYNYVLAVIMGLPDTYDFWFSLNNTGITRIDYTPEQTYITYMNRVEFLPRALVT
jgi:2,3-bisphosphoglycerate-dependent phosphoglycerate mutase